MQLYSKNGKQCAYAYIDFQILRISDIVVAASQNQILLLTLVIFSIPYSFASW